MKKILLLAAMAMMGLQMQAQLVGSTMTMKKTEVVEVKETVDEKWGWNTLAFEYLPKTFKPDLSGYGSSTLHGFSFTWMRAISLTHNHRVPLYLEPGVGLEFAVANKELASNTDLNFGMLSVKIPLNFIYDIHISNTSIHIAPFLGLRFRINAYGEFKFDGKYGSNNTYNAFDKKDMGDDPFSRFQMGWTLGCKFRFSKFYMGFGYGTDFNKISNHNTMDEWLVSLGVAF